MLQNISVSNATAIAARLAQSGVGLQVASGANPLSLLVQANVTPNVVMNYNEPDIQKFGAILLEASRERLAGDPEHDLVSAEVVEAISGAVRYSMDRARNQVNPAIKTLIAKIEENVNRYTMSDICPISIVPRFYTDVWANSKLEDLVQPFKNGSRSDIITKYKVGQPLHFEGILQLLSTGAGAFDEEVLKAFEGKNQMVEDTYGSLFSFTCDRFFNWATVLNPYHGNPEQILLCHLLARKLLAEIPEGLDVPLPAYRAHVSDILNQSGVAILGVLKNRQDQITHKKLVIAFPTAEPVGVKAENGIIMVNGDVYNAWLKEGGSPEILMGSYITDRNTNYSQLITDQGRYLQEYKRFQNLRNNALIENRHSILMGAVRGAMLQLINETGDIPDGPSIAMQAERFHELYRNIARKETENVYLLARKLICRTQYAHTDAEIILDNIDSISEGNKDLSIEEAVSLAALDYIADWLVSFIIPV
jgi:hypothetical protein